MDYKLFKSGDKVVRYYSKTRDSGFVTVHDFTLYSSVFDRGVRHDSFDLHKLHIFLADVFMEDMPERDKSSSSAAVLDVDWKEHETDLIEHADKSNYRGWGRNQHPIVQRYLHENDAFTIASEVPLWDEEKTGFIDVLRVHKDGRIEIADFKPKAAKEKKAASQIKHYKDMLCNMAHISPDKVFCTYFDDEDAYILLEP